MAVLKTYNGYPLWLYLPSTIAAVIFTVLFGLGAIAISWRMFTTRAWYCTAFLIGVLFQVIGYAARAAAREKTDQLMPFIIQSVFILVAPALFAASVYMVLGRVIVSIRGERHSIIRVKWLTTLFVMGDVVSFVVQSSGAGLMVMDGMMKTGEKIIIGGLFVQIIVFGLFIVTSVLFHRRVNRHDPTTSQTYGDQWRRTLIMLYIVSVFILVRSVFRVIEYIMGNDGYLLKNEWTLYVFDAVLMFGVVAIFAWEFPGTFKVKSAEFEMSSQEEALSSTPQFGATTEVRAESENKARY
ncbi:RTA1 like protein-domain-containing protein [Plectosphaerella plurivora]|uniref:RTA1 like protein-domain-containing protein n=1 Tax=Plectosphaerella plurivora TaxID=936078 RepID=A0A9P9AAS0_9PEZI|nr:RTA1 like protein-domain-containing protein [Plectosphaerella plurivora]